MPGRGSSAASRSSISSSRGRRRRIDDILFSIVFHPRQRSRIRRIEPDLVDPRSNRRSRPVKSSEGSSMRAPRVPFTVQGIIVAVVMGAVPGRASEDSPKARLAAIEAAQKVARERYSGELQKVERTEAAQQSATDRFLEELRRN